jgi:hypothetical protein
MNPTGEKWMDGTTLSPHELMFIKVKDHLLMSTNSLSKAAAKTSDWMDGLVPPVPPPTTLTFIPFRRLWWLLF